MNDIEALISGLPRPSPSEDLDVRLAKIFYHPTQTVVLGAPRRWVSVLATCAVCAGLTGFMLGRLSMTPAIGTTVTVITPQAPPREMAPDRNGVPIDLAEQHALAEFVMLPKRSESLFGNGPLEVQSGSTPFE